MQPAPQSRRLIGHQPHLPLAQANLPDGLTHRQGPAGTRRGQLRRATGAHRHAVRPKRTGITIRPCARTHRCPQIHLRLRIVGHDRSVLRQQLFGQLPQPDFHSALARPALDSEHATQYPLHIAVQDGLTLAIGLRHNGCCGGAPDPRQGFPASPIRGKAALRHNLLRRPVQITTAGVVAQPTPQRQHLGHIGRSQRLHVRKARHETLKIRDHRLHLRLLQHHLRHPHSVGRAWVLPWQIMAAVPPVPRQQPLGKALNRGVPDFFRIDFFHSPRCTSANP